MTAVEPTGPGEGPHEDRVHPLVPPLGLAVITLIGGAVVIGFGHPNSSKTQPPAPDAGGPYRGGKLAPHRKQPPKKPKPKPPKSKPVEIPAWLARELGPKSPGAPLARVVSADLRIEITARGYRIVYRGARLARDVTDVGLVGTPVRHVDGVTRRIRAGADVTVVKGSTTSSYIVVTRRRSRHVWSWLLQTNLTPSVRGDGALLLSGTDSFLVQPPNVLDRGGEDVTPQGLRWRVRRTGAGRFALSIRLDDRQLPLPYVIAG